jgi:hypothetical protein
MGLFTALQVRIGSYQNTDIFFLITDISRCPSDGIDGEVRPINSQKWTKWDEDESA